MPIPPDRRELAMLGGLAAANVALNRIVPHARSREIPSHVAVAALMLGIAMSGRAVPRWPEHLTRNQRRGVVAGLAVGVPLGTVLTLAPVIPPVRRFFHDERIAGIEAADASYQLIARIPIATALCEEVIFRVAVPDLLKRRRSALEAEIVCACLFGLWHVLPSIDRLHTNAGTASVHRNGAIRQVAVVAGTVGVTTVAGVGFSKLRDVSGSVIAPIIAHAAINGGAFLGGWLSSRVGRPKPAAGSRGSSEVKPQATPTLARRHPSW